MEQENQQSGAVLTSITDLRRRRKLRRTRRIVLISVLVLAAIIYFSGAWSKAFTSMEEFSDSIRIALEPQAGWPVKTGIPEILQLEPLSGGFVELGEKDLAVFSSGGNKLRSIQHGYARPVISTGSSKFCLYNRSGNELRVESRGRSLYTKTFDRPIFMAEMSPNGSVAAVTGSRTGLAKLTVLDPSMRFRYEWTITEENGMPQSIAFAPDNRRFAVACLTAENGGFRSNLYFLDTTEGDVPEPLVSYGGAVLQMHWISPQRLLVIYQGKAVVYDAATSSEMSVYSYGGRPLAAASVSGQNVALLFSQPLSDTPGQLVVLDPSMQVLADVQIPAPAVDVTLTRTAVYVLRRTSVAAYQLDGEPLWENDLGTPPLVVLDAKKPLVFTGGEASLLKGPAEERSLT